jgi:hypothetical protein
MWTNKTHGVRVRSAAFIPSPRGGDCIGPRESRRKLRFPQTATGKQMREREVRASFNLERSCLHEAWSQTPIVNWCGFSPSISYHACTSSFFFLLYSSLFLVLFCFQQLKFTSITSNVQMLIRSIKYNLIIKSITQVKTNTRDQSIKSN